MKRILYLCFFLSFTACTSNTPATAETYPTTPNGLQGIEQPAVNNSPVQAGNTAAVNPPHGQPGHNCDLAVGAPLNPTTPVAASEANLPADTAVKTPVMKDKNQRLNPVHGQPGHNCDIAVGAPLT